MQQMEEILREKNGESQEQARVIAEQQNEIQLLKKALREVIDQNDALTEHVRDMTGQLAEKDDMISRQE